jgi:hypothetical protein
MATLQQSRNTRKDSVAESPKPAGDVSTDSSPNNQDAPPVTVPDPPIPAKQDVLPIPDLSFGLDPLHNDGTGWSAMAKIVREVDEQKVKDYKEDIDTILLFVRRILLALSQ